MPTPPENTFTVPEYTGPGLAQNLPDTQAAPVSAPVPLARGVKPVVHSEPWSLAKRLGFSALMLLIAAGLGWFTVWTPLETARHGQPTTYSVKGVLLTSVIVYLAVIALFADLRDHQIRQIGPNGKGKLTTRGYVVLAGSFVAMGIGIFLFNLALSQYGYTIF